jgi:hypothetical protein
LYTAEKKTSRVEAGCFLFGLEGSRLRFFAFAPANREKAETMTFGLDGKIRQV